MQGRIVQLNVSPGGVPKRPVARARVTRLGLEGDGHRNAALHGGPDRALCLFPLERIEVDGYFSDDLAAGHAETGSSTFTLDAAGSSAVPDAPPTHAPLVRGGLTETFTVPPLLPHPDSSGRPSRRGDGVGGLPEQPASIAG